MIGRGHGWRTLSLAVASTGCGLLAVMMVASMLAYAAFAPAGSGPDFGSPKPLQLIVLAGALSLMGAILFAASYHSVRSLFGREVPAYAPKPFRPWQWTALLFLWIAAASLSQVLSQQSTWAWLTPAFYLAAIAAPAYFFVRLAAGGLHAGSLRRIWGIIATAMVAGTGLALLVELAFAILGLLVAGVYLALNPSLLAAIQEFAARFANAAGREDVLVALQPWLEKPVVLVSAIVVVSGLIPVIEESAKSLAVWAVFDHLDSPAQGFVAGALSGAGFGMVESLLASATPDANWSVALLVRGASTMMHIMATGLTGWGIASSRAGKRVVPALRAFGVAIALHSLWNASVVMIAFGGVRTAFDLTSADALGTALIVLGSAVLGILCTTIPIALASINWKLRSATQSGVADASTGEAAPGRSGRENSTAASER